jgi:hypothetical protein
MAKAADDSSGKRVRAGRLLESGGEKVSGIWL